MAARHRFAFALLACALLLPSASAKDKKKTPATTATDDPSRGVNFYSLEREIALGKQMAAEVERESRLVEDPLITEYVSRIAQNLVRNSDAKVPFTIQVIESGEINAFALPGGFLFVDTGLLLRAENEAEFAGVLSHEIAHVAARHGTRQATRGQLINYASIPLIFVGGGLGYVLREAATLAAPVGFLQFSRAMETQADYLGLEYMDRSGYDPTAFVDFFERLGTLEKSKPGTIARLFSTHPMTNDRIKRAQKEIQTRLKAHAEYVLDTSEFHEVRDKLQAREDRRNAFRQEYSPVLLRRRRN